MKSLAALLMLPFAATAAAPAAHPAQPAAGQPRAGIAAKVAPGVVDIQTARNLVAAGIRVVDVRTPAEFATGHVHSAVNIPVDEIERRYAELGPPSTPVLLYCRSGNRSGRATKILQARGFTTVYDFQAYDLWVKSEPPKSR